MLQCFMRTGVHIKHCSGQVSVCQEERVVREETRLDMLPADSATPLGSRTRRERRDAMEHRQCILQVARSLFAKQGVDAVSMHQIAKAAGIGQGTLYRRYAHKGELCMDLLHERHEELRVEIEKLFEQKKHLPALTRLDSVLLQSINFLEEQGALLTAIVQTQMQETMCRKAPNIEQMSAYYWLHTMFASLLTEAVEWGELAPLDVSFTADALLATLNPMFYRMQRQERGLSPEHILQGLRHIYITGMKW